MNYSFSSLLLLGVLTVALGCTSDQLPEPEEAVCGNDPITYDNDIAGIVERSCAYSGCHLGSAPGIYDDYDGVLPVLESGLFRQRVIEQRMDPNTGMPPNFAPADRPQDLTERELEMITCWLEAGFPR